MAVGFGFVVARRLVVAGGARRRELARWREDALQTEVDAAGGRVSRRRLPQACSMARTVARGGEVAVVCWRG